MDIIPTDHTTATARLLIGFVCACLLVLAMAALLGIADTLRAWHRGEDWRAVARRHLAEW